MLDDLVPAPLSPQNQLDQLADRAATTAGGADPVDTLTYLRRSVGRRGRQADAREHRQIEEIVSHERDSRVLESGLSSDGLVRIRLVCNPLRDDPDPELRGALRRGTRGSGRQQSHRQARTLCPYQGSTVPDVEALGFRSVRVHQHPAVGEHTIDVEQEKTHH